MWGTICEDYSINNDEGDGKMLNPVYYEKEFKENIRNLEEQLENEKNQVKVNGDSKIKNTLKEIFLEPNIYMIILAIYSIVVYDYALTRIMFSLVLAISALELGLRFNGNKRTQIYYEGYKQGKFDSKMEIWKALN